MSDTNSANSTTKTDFTPDYSKFNEIVKQDTPRLVISYKSINNQDTFQWGVLGHVPVLTLIGAITRVQAEYFFTAHPCPESALVIAWSNGFSSSSIDWFIHEDIPQVPVMGMLEVVKATIVNTHVARQAAAQQVRILGPDGAPVRN